MSEGTIEFATAASSLAETDQYLLNTSTHLVKKATGAQLREFMGSGLVTSTAAALTVTAAAHAGRTVVLSKADGQAVTLPAASGSGAKFKFVLGIAVASVGTTIKVVGNDIMQGMALAAADGGNTLNAWETASDSDTVTFDGSTTGGKVGDVVELEDIAADLWAVQIRCAQTGTEATPFSATVS